MENLKAYSESLNESSELPSFELFKNFDKITLRQILSTGHYFIVDDNESLFNEKRSNTDAYLVLEGMLYTYSKSEVMITYKNGDCINPGFLHCPTMAFPDIRSSGSSKVFCYKRSEILNFFREHSEKVFKLFTMNVIQCQQRMIADLLNKPGLNSQNQ